MSNQVQISGGLKVRNLNGLLKATDGVVTATESEFISVKDFGAIGNGIADDTAAIQAAVTFMSTTGGVLFFPVGTYKVTSEITQTYNTAVNFKMIGYGAIIDGSTSTSTNLFNLKGKQDASSLLSANLIKGDVAITTLSSISATDNDFIMLQSTDLWSPARSYYYKGEISQVLNNSGTTYNLGSQLFDGYTASTTTAYKLIMPTIEIEGMEFIRNGYKIGINIEYATNVSISNCKIHGARYAALQLNLCYGGLVQNNQIYDCYSAGSGTSYAVSISSCQFVKVANNTLSETRHCITAGGTIPSRSHIFIGNSCLVHPSQGRNIAIDTHGNTELITIEGNYANGIDVTGRSAIIIGNTLIGINTTPSGSSNEAVIIIGPESGIDNVEIRNNTIESNFDFTNSSGILFSPQNADDYFDNIIISDNNIKAGKSGITFVIVNSSYTGNIINNLIISNNNIEVYTGYALSIAGISTMGYTVNNLNSNNNKYYSNQYSAIIRSYCIVNNSNFINDKFYSGNSGGFNISFNGLDKVIFNNCLFEGNVSGLGNAGDVYISSTSNIYNYNPITNNITRINIGTSTIDYLEQGRTGNNLTTLVSSNTRLINGYSRFGYAYQYATTTPTTGYWNRYDEIYNTNNAIGNPLKWVCDTAGSPGTWRAIYTIETYPTFSRIDNDLSVTGKLITNNTSFTNGVLIKAGGNLTGASTSIAFYQKSIISSDVNNANGFRSELQTDASSFTLNEYSHFSALQSVIGAGSTVTTQVGFSAGSNLIGATTNIGFRGSIPSGTNSWNLYLSGTASNYINGTTLFGSTSDSGLAKVQITGAIQQSSVISSLLKSDANGVLVAAVAGTDYLEPSSLTSYVPYTGATQTVDLGSYDLNARGIKINGTGGLGHADFKHQSGTPTGSASSSTLYANSNGDIAWLNDHNYTITLTASSNTADRTYTFQNANGTLAFLSDIPSLSGYVQGTGTTNTLPKFTAASTIGNSNISDSGTLITLNIDTYINGSIGIGINPVTGFNVAVQKNITGAATAYGIASLGQIQTDVTTARYFYTSPSQVSGANTASIQHFYATQGVLSGTSTNQIGFYVASTLTGATSNFAFRSDIAAGTNRWNIYMNGTANNYMAGNLAIGSTSVLTSFLNIAAGTTAKAQINLASSTAPTTPNNGDIWFDGTDLKIRVGGVTKTFTII